MKKFFVKMASICLAIGTLSALAACGGDKLPTTNYEKVKFAFSGVEKSFKNIDSNQRNKLPIKDRTKGSNESEALNTLYGLFTSDDARGSISEELGFNEPPMVQFQYLKKVLEKIGNNYSFGNKYYDTMTGEVFIDKETGYKTSGDAYKYNYTFVLGMDINIDSNDLITADVSFDIKLVQGETTYQSKWYVNIELDYDMTNQSPNYTMTMVNENDELGIPYIGEFIYEYDYVNVNNNTINEWRKFCLSDNKRLVKDSSHPTFESYIGDDFSYDVGCFAWYKNNSFRKNNELDSNKKLIFAEQLFTGLNLNANGINADAFFNKEGSQNSVIKTCYQEFSSLYGDDIIYDMVSRDKDDSGQQQEKTPSMIKIMNRDLSGDIGGDSYTEEIRFKDLFNNARLFYADQNGELIEEIDNWPALAFFFKAKGLDSVTPVQLEDSVKTGYYNLMGQYQVGLDQLGEECELYILDANYIAGRLPFNYYGDKGEDITMNKTFPEELKKYGIPEFEGEEYSYNLEKDGETYHLTISRTNRDDVEEYLRKLSKSGFEEFSSDEYKGDGLLKKGNVIVIIHTSNLDKGYIVLDIFYENGQSGGQGGEDEPNRELPEVLVNYGLPEFVGENYSYDYDDYDLHLRLTINNTTPEENDGYLEILQGAGFKFVENNTEAQFLLLKNLVYVEYTDKNESLVLEVYVAEIHSVSIVGDFNGWSLTDNVIEFMPREGSNYATDLTSFTSGHQFKIVINNSWELGGGYGYSKISNIKDHPKCFREGTDNDNIKVLNNCTAVFTFTVNYECGIPEFKIAQAQAEN